ncbi:MAG TPA: hypothetical protein DHU63_01390 [Candidatus Marinimicrobia bacterium]|nr:hypothetical protein [Candidatus Neomarinimicrobiota bacterium]
MVLFGMYKSLMPFSTGSSIAWEMNSRDTQSMPFWIPLLSLKMIGINMWLIIIRNRFHGVMLLLVALAFSLPVCGAPQVIDSTNPMTLKVKDVKLSQVLRIISEKSGLKFIADPAISDKLISLDLNEVEPLAALSIIAQLYNLGYQELSEPNKYLVADKNTFAVETEMGFYSCQFARAEEMAAILGKLATPFIGQLFADVRTNTVIYQDTPEKIEQIKEMIVHLDKPTRQVFIKSAIAEASLSKGNDRGVQWFTNDDKVAAGTDFNLRSGVLGSLPLEPVRPVGLGLGIGILDMNIDVAIKLLSTVNDLNLLSTPYLLTLDNQSASITVGDQIPYPKLNQFGVTSYEFKDATIQLKLLPHINNDSTITIDIEPQANFQQGFTPDGIPIISTRSAKTQVVVKAGRTIVIGGIMQESDVKTESRVPILGAIPLIGEFFKQTKITKQKTELVVLLTPQIVGLTQEVEAVAPIPPELKERLK